MASDMERGTSLQRARTKQRLEMRWLPGIGTGADRKLGRKTSAHAEGENAPVWARRLVAAGDLFPKPDEPVWNCLDRPCTRR
jgi:hypothetical protein